MALTAPATITILLSVLAYADSHIYSYHNANGKQYTRPIILKQGVLHGVKVDPTINPYLPPVEQYLGIPYAAPPVGELRFMPPVDAPTWPGIKYADDFGPVCPQKFPDMNEMAPWRKEYFKKLAHYLTNQSEDCLYLNVYAPSQEDKGRKHTRKYPVMVFIHGESFEWNSGNPYDGSVLAAYGGVVVVTLNFRLGVLGFLKVGRQDSAPANFGLVDLIAALYWIQMNIEAFGGDSESVTLFGHGTGAVCANLLMLSTFAENKIENKPLFHRVILMSGTALADWAFASNPHQVTFQIAERLNCPRDDNQMAACLRRRSLNEIMAASAYVDQYRTRFGPIVDGRIIPNEPKLHMTVYNSLFKQFELMYGVTEVESVHLLGPFAVDGLSKPERDQELRKYLATRCETHSDQCLQRTLNEYLEISEFVLKDQGRIGSEAPSLARDYVLDILSDARSAAPVILTGNYHSKLNKNSYFYVFGYSKSPKDFAHYKCTYGEELPYVFGVPLDGPKFHFDADYNEREQLFSEAVMTYWTNFAKTGNPNRPKKSSFMLLSSFEWSLFNIEWPQYNRDEQEYMNMTIIPQIGRHYRAKKMRFWNEILPNISKYDPEIFVPARKISPIVPEKVKIDYFQPLRKSPPVWLTEANKPSKTPKTTVFGTVMKKPPAEVMENDALASTQTGSATNIVIIIGVLFVVINVIICGVLYYKCVRAKRKHDSPDEPQVASDISEKVPKIIDDEPSSNGCNLIRMISKSTKSGDTYEAVKVSEDGSNFRFKLARQMSSSTIDPHTKVRDWITQEVVQKFSPRFFRRTRPLSKAPKVDSITETDSTIGRSSTRPVSPAESKEPSSIPLKKKSGKVSVAVDATPSGRGSSVMRQQPIELTKSLDYPTFSEVDGRLKRSATFDNVDRPLQKSSTNINLKPLKIQHHHSKSDPVEDTLKSVKKLKTFGPAQDVNVTSRDEVPVVPLTAEEALMTIKRRNFPKVLPDLPHKRRSMPAPGHLFLAIPESVSVSQPNSPTGKICYKLPPLPPPRTSSTLGRKPLVQSAAVLAEEPPTPSEPELTCNNLFIGPLIPKPEETYKLNTQPIYDNLLPVRQNEAKSEKSAPKTIITTDPDHPIRRVEPKIIIKPTSRKVGEVNRNKNTPRVTAQLDSETSGADDKVASSIPIKTNSLRRGLKPSQIPTLGKSLKESSGSDSTPSDASDTGTVVKRA